MTIQTIYYYLPSDLRKLIPQPKVSFTQKMSSVGYICVIGNKKMPELVKICSTTHEPYTLLAGLDKQSVIVMKKKVVNPNDQARVLRKALEQYRVPEKNKIFRISAKDIRPFFDVMAESKSVPRGVRQMDDCFVDGSLIRHMIDLKLVSGVYENSVWVGVYNASRRGIVYNDELYKSMSGFATAHYEAVRPDRTSAVNGWKECEYQVAGEWRSTFNI